MTVELDWAWFEEKVEVLVSLIGQQGLKPKNIYGVPRGGLALAQRLSYLLDVPMLGYPHLIIGRDTLVVDDICDSGQTLQNLDNQYGPFKTAVLITRADSSVIPCLSAETVTHGDWFIFPWEKGALKDTVSQVVPK